MVVLVVVLVEVAEVLVEVLSEVVVVLSEVVAVEEVPSVVIAVVHLVEIVVAVVVLSEVVSSKLELCLYFVYNGVFVENRLMYHRRGENFRRKSPFFIFVFIFNTLMK